MKVLGIVCSNRKGGNTEIMVMTETFHRPHGIRSSSIAPIIPQQASRSSCFSVLGRKAATPMRSPSLEVRRRTVAAPRPHEVAHSALGSPVCSPANDRSGTRGRAEGPTPASRREMRLAPRASTAMMLAAPHHAAVRSSGRKHLEVLSVPSRAVSCRSSFGPAKAGEFCLGHFGIVCSVR